MKTFIHPCWRRYTRAMTVLETMIAMTFFTFIIGGILYAHVTGIKMFRILQAKMGASAESRVALNRMSFEIKSADKVVVGTGSSNSFTPVATNALHVGNAIQIYPVSTNTGYYIRYFLNTTSAGTNYAGTNYAKLIRGYVTNGGTMSYKKIAENITNCATSTHPNPPAPFALEYFQGGAMTDEVPEKQQVLSMDFIFYQLQYPIIRLGTNYLYDYYEYRTKLTSRIH